MITLTDEQEEIKNKAIEWYKRSSEQVFQISGSPGTGKSILINAIVKSLNLDPDRVANMAYTGCASLVMRMKGLKNAKTIHSWLYDMIEEPVLDENGALQFDEYFHRPLKKITFKRKFLTDIDLIVIDEGGMVPLAMKEDIESQGKKIIVAGDLDQLPPVMDAPAYLYNGEVHRLTKIMRQSEQSPIIYLSQRAKQGLPINTGLYGNDVLVINEDELTNEMISGSDIMLCGKNATRDRLNNQVRYSILHKSSKLPEFGERVIFRKNNWNLEYDGINITNGLTGKIVSTPDPSRFDGKMFSIDFLSNFSSTVFTDVNINYKYFLADTEAKKVIKNMNSKYYQGELLEFAYSLTTHLAQGNTFRSGIYFEEFLNKEINNALNYTGITRFARKLIYVKPKKKFTGGYNGKTNNYPIRRFENTRKES